MKIRKICTVLVGIISAAALSVCVAASQHNRSNGQSADSSANASSSKSDLILMYSSPKKGEVIKKLAPNLRLIPIYRQGNWVKIGDPTNGNTGWINLVQYQKARYNYYRPDIQTLYVHINDKQSGKPTLNIVAYKNGKQVNNKEALKIYQRLRQREAQQFSSMQHATLSMQQMMNQDFGNAQSLFDSSWWNPPVMMPVILMPLQQQGDNNNSNQTNQDTVKNLQKSI